MPNRFLLFPLAAALALTTACGQTKTREIRRGRLSYVETLRYGAVGTHYSHGWYVSDREFQVNGRRWKPPGINVEGDIANADASPNPSVEAIRSYSFVAMKENVYVLHMKGGQPEWVTASVSPYDTGDNLGQWTGEGRWLLFRDHYFNVETAERREIKELPDSPDRYFVAASPDLETIIFREECFRREYDPKTARAIPDEEADRRCDLVSEHASAGIAGFWLIEARTGQMRMLALIKADYPWATHDHNDPQTEWLRNFRDKLRWEKDGGGRDRLAYPK